MMKRLTNLAVSKCLLAKVIKDSFSHPIPRKASKLLCDLLQADTFEVRRVKRNLEHQLLGRRALFNTSIDSPPHAVCENAPHDTVIRGIASGLGDIFHVRQ